MRSSSQTFSKLLSSTSTKTYIKSNTANSLSASSIINTNNNVAYTLYDSGIIRKLKTLLSNQSMFEDNRSIPVYYLIRGNHIDTVINEIAIVVFSQSDLLIKLSNNALHVCDTLI